MANEKTYDWKKLFLEAMAETPVVKVACKAAGVSRQHAYKARRDDPDFLRAWDIAVEDGLDLVDASVHESAKLDLTAALYILNTRRYRRHDHSPYDHFIQDMDDEITMVWEDGDPDLLPE